MTGVDIHGPEAKLSAEAAIEFNVAEAMGMNCVPSGEPNPAFPDIVRWKGDDDPKVNPLLPVQPTRTRQPEGWKVDADAITKSWKEKEGVAEQVLALWTGGGIAAFKDWEFDRGEKGNDDTDTSGGKEEEHAEGKTDGGKKKEKTKLGVLQAKAPVETLRRFEELYLDMPWLTAAVAA